MLLHVFLHLLAYTGESVMDKEARILAYYTKILGPWNMADDSIPIMVMACPPQVCFIKPTNFHPYVDIVLSNYVYSWTLNLP